MNKDFVKRMTHEALIVLGLLAFFTFMFRLWPLLILVIFCILLGAIRLLFLKVKEQATVKQAEEDTERDWQALEQVLSVATDRFLDARRTEGARIESDLRAKIDNIKTRVDTIETLSKEDIVTYRDRLEEKIRAVLADAVITVDENRLLTECAIYADKVAVDEELVRLRSHFVAFDQYLAETQPVGRSIDFLLQEINREINTTGSKCSNAAIAKLVVEVKTELEKIREQIQNIE